MGWLVVAVALGVTTFSRNHDYRSVEAIWADTAQKQPRNGRAWCLWAMSLFESAKFRGAREAFAHALALEPDDLGILLDLGQIQARSGESGPGGDDLSLDPKKDPHHPDAHYNLGVLLAQRDNLVEAAQHFVESIAAKPGDAATHYNLANTLVRLDRATEALPHYRAALELDPEMPGVRENFARTLLLLSRASDALALLEPSTVKTGDLQLTRSLALIAAGRRDEAIGELESLLRQKPEWAQAHANLGLALIESGRLVEGADQYETALRVGSRNLPDGTKIDLHVSLAEALLQLGRRAEAITHYQAALELAPGSVELRAALDQARASTNPSRSP